MNTKVEKRRRRRWGSSVTPPKGVLRGRKEEKKERENFLMLILLYYGKVVRGIHTVYAVHKVQCVQYSYAPWIMRLGEK